MESDFIKQEHQSLMPVEENQVVEVEEIVEVDEDFADNDASNGGQESKDRSLIGQLRGLLTKEALQDPAKRKKLIYLVAGVLLLLIFLEVPEEDVAPKKKNVKAQEKPLKKKTSLDPKVLEFVDSTYQLALELFERAKYQECIHQLDALFQKTPTYKQAKSLYQAAKDALKELEIIEEKNRKLKAMIERKKKIQKLLDKANQAVTSRRVELAEQIFLQIVQLDPENLDVVQLRLELDHYKKKKEKEEIEKAAKKSERKRQEKALLPGKLLYSKKKWYSAVIELEKLINKEKNLDKDLFDEADKMLVESQNNLDGLVSPLLAKARSLKEGKDLKGAYEQYLEILSHDPEHFEAFKQMREIRQQLETRSKTIYREGIISESLSLFHQAKEKFQEVQQVSPIDSKYYKKATQKLKDYGE